MNCSSMGRLFGLFCSVAVAMTAVAHADDASNDRIIADQTELIRANPENAIAYEKRGGAYFNKGDKDRAVEDCSSAIRIDPKFAKAYSCRGLAYAGKGERERALADYNEAIRVNPQYGPPYTYRALEYFNKGDYDLAITHITEAIERNPTATYFPLVIRGQAYESKDDHEHAIADYNAAMRLNPASSWPYELRGLAYSNKGEGDKAFDDCNTAVRLEPKSAGAHYCRGLALINKGDTDSAIQDLDEAIKISPIFAKAYVLRGSAYRKKDENRRAIADFDEGIRLRPGNAMAYNNRGNALRDIGEHARALADYAEATRLNPKNQTAFANRGLLYAKLSDAAKARADFNSVLALPVTDKWAYDTAREQLALLSASKPLKRDTIDAAVVAALLAKPKDNRIALVIGNSAYANAPGLSNPERDATLVADALKRAGLGSVSIKTNLGKDALLSVLRDFAKQAETADWAVIYYAGHGMEVGGINYLVPVDAKIAADRDIGFEAIPLEQVLNAAERARKLRIVILDACRDNPFANQMKRTMTAASRSVSRGLARVEPEAGTLVVYAAKDGETALDGDNGNSPFATAFVKNLLTPGLEVRRLFDFVRDDVMDATNRQQKPFSYGSVSGRQDFFFVAAK